jgi:hypothetical protein
MAILINVPKIPLWVPPDRARVINNLTRTAAELALMEVAGRLADEAPRDTGHLAQSFGNNPATVDGGIEMIGQDTITGINGRVFSSLPYAIVMDQGRTPGSAPPPTAPIALWAQRKLGLSATEAARAAFVIARHIGKFGIKGLFFADSAFRLAEPTVNRIFSILGDQIGRALVTPGGARQ